VTNQLKSVTEILSDLHGDVNTEVKDLIKMLRVGPRMHVEMEEIAKLQEKIKSEVKTMTRSTKQLYSLATAINKGEVGKIKTIDENPNEYDLDGNPIARSPPKSTIKFDQVAMDPQPPKT
jgi:hypothetical protein